MTFIDPIGTFITGISPLFLDPLNSYTTFDHTSFHVKDFFFVFSKQNTSYHLLPLPFSHTKLQSDCTHTRHNYSTRPRLGTHYNPFTYNQFMYYSEKLKYLNTASQIDLHNAPVSEQPVRENIFICNFHPAHFSRRGVRDVIPDPV